MDQCSRNVETEADNPEDHEGHNDRPDHRNTSYLRIRPPPFELSLTGLLRSTWPFGSTAV